MTSTFPIHIRTVTGLEGLLAEEVSALGAKQIEAGNRGVTCLGDLEVLYKANIWCRTAIRVLRPLTSFPAKDEKALYKGIQSIDWSRWMSALGTIAVDANVSSSFTTHSLFVAQLAKDAVVDQFREKSGNRPSVDLENPDLRIVISLFQNTAQVSLDSSGESLHKRGYRLKTGEAPISEVLAAGILKLSGWDQKSPLLDPMTGSGTFCIEAALLARNIAPGLLRRHYGFHNWPDFDGALFQRLLNEAADSVLGDIQVPIIGLEIDDAVAEIARQNVENAGLTDIIRIERADFFNWNGLPETKGTVVLNPPYDERLGVDNVAELYQRIGDRLKQAYSGWTAFVLSGNLEAVKYIGLRSSQRVPLFNGPIETRLLKFELHASEGKRPVYSVDNSKWLAKAEMFRNRLQKNLKNYGKWAEREGVTNWRVFDWDVPELPFILELYGDALRFEEIPRNQDHTAIEHSQFQKLMVKTAVEVLQISAEKVFFCVRNPKASPEKFQKADFSMVKEGKCKYLVRLGDALDVGLDLRNRKIRSVIQKEAEEKEFLSLYSYTGAFALAAAVGNAKSTTSVDTSGIHLEWAQENFKLNGIGGNNWFFRSEISEFLRESRNRFDLCVVESPSRVLIEHSRDLLEGILKVMRPGGKIYFISGMKDFTLTDKRAKEITQKVSAFDFDRKPNMRVWVIELGT